MNEKYDSFSYLHYISDRIWPSLTETLDAINDRLEKWSEERHKMTQFECEGIRNIFYFSMEKFDRKELLLRVKNRIQQEINEKYEETVEVYVKLRLVDPSMAFDFGFSIVAIDENNELSANWGRL